MSERVVLITGAKGGLGLFVTQRFVATGATVVGASRSIAQEDFPVANFAALPVDFTRAAAVHGAINSVIDRYGRLDVLVHVVGGFAGGMSVAETDDAYVAFKSALASLVRTVALENKDAGLTANVVLPGTMDTPANRKAMPGADFSKWLKPADVADLVLWLADERAGHITGTVIPIDGANP